MAHPPEKKTELRAAFLGGLPLERAAEKVEVPLPTARRWYQDAKRGGDDWDKYRAAGLVVAGGGIEQALGRVISAALVRCEVLLEELEKAEDPFQAVKAMGTLADTSTKLKAAAKGLMPEADALAVETGAIKALADLFCKMHPGHAEAMLATVEAYANGQR